MVKNIGRKSFRRVGWYILGIFLCGFPAWYTGMMLPDKLFWFMVGAWACTGLFVLLLAMFLLKPLHCVQTNDTEVIFRKSFGRVIKVPFASIEKIAVKQNTSSYTPRYSLRSYTRTCSDGAVIVYTNDKKRIWFGGVAYVTDVVAELKKGIKPSDGN